MMRLFMAGRVSHARRETLLLSCYDRRLVSFHYRADLPTLIKALQDKIEVILYEVKKTREK